MVDLLSPRLTPLPSRQRLEEKIVVDHVNYTLTLCAPSTEMRIGLLVGNDPIDNIDPLGLLTVHYWAPQTVNAHGHLSITLDDGTYISNWPTDEANILATSDTRTPNYHDDNAEEGTTPTDLYIGNLDEKKIEDWWNKQPRKNGYSGLSSNCSSTAANALRQGGLPVKSPTFYYSPTTTWPLIKDAVNNRKTGGAGGSW